MLDLVATRVTNRIFNISKRRNWSVEALLEMLQKVSDGEYHLGTTAASSSVLPPPSMNWVVVQRFMSSRNLPSPFLNIVNKIRKGNQLRINVGSVKMSDLLANIETMFKDVKHGHRGVGITLSMMGLQVMLNCATIQRPTNVLAFVSTRQRSYHSLRWATNLDVIRAVTQAIREGRVL